MSVQRQSVPPTDADLETTAELPVLDVAAYEASTAEDAHTGSTDTWHFPSIPVPAATEAATSAEVTAAEDRSTQLEMDLRSLSESLRDVEGRLTRKGERLIELERELANARAERVAVDERAARLISEAEQRAAILVSDAEARASAQVAAAEERAYALNAQLDELRAALVAAQARAEGLHASVESHTAAALESQRRDQDRATRVTTLEQELATARADLRAAEARASSQLEALHTLEGRRVIFEGQLLGLDDEVAQQDAQLAQLRKELAARDTQARELAAELAERKQRVESLEREVSALAGSLGQRNVELEQVERAKSKLQGALTTHAEIIARNQERIRQLESTANDQSASVSERSKELDRLSRERDSLVARVAALEADLAEVRAGLAEKGAELQAASAARSDLEKHLAESQLRVETLDRDLAVARAENAERAAAMLRVEAERDEQMKRLAESEVRGVELAARCDENAEVIRQLQEELRTSLMRATELEGDLRAAEDAINRIETDLRLKSSKLEDLNRTQEEWRSTVESARQSLAERDSLINRLETEAANSAQLLGNIQQSIKRLDPNAQSGNHEIAPEGAVRLLIRVDGDSEVVHVLGRKTTVGRTPDNDLQIDTKFISRNHAVILAGPNHTIIEDLNSTNGVAVNGRRVSRHAMRDGDVVSIGKTTFRFAVRPMGERRTEGTR